MTKNIYKNMWEDYAKKTLNMYLKDKYFPLNQRGLSNYMREQYILKYSKKLIKGNFIDIGCASGRQVFKLSSKVKNATGVDISKEYIKHAKITAKERNIKNCKFLVSKVENLPFKKNTFDFMLCSEVLEHVEDLEKSFKELSRVLKKDGYAILTVPNLNSDGSLVGRILRLFRLRKFVPLTDFTKESVKKHKDTHVREFTQETFLKACRKNKLKPIKYTLTGYTDFGWNLPLAIILRIPPLQKFIIYLEKKLSNMQIDLGQNIIVLCKNEK